MVNISCHHFHVRGTYLLQPCELCMESNSKVGPVKQSQGQTVFVLSAIIAIASSVCLTGCQTTIGGQTLPSPNYLEDDVQYFPSGPEFPLTNKVAAQRKYNAERASLDSHF